MFWKMLNVRKWRILNSKLAFDTKWFKVRQDKVELPSGVVIDDYYVWLAGDVAMIVPITKNNEIILVRQYKHALGEVIVEYPAGYVDEGEDVKVAAERELREETGYTAKEFSLMTKFVNNPTKEEGILNIFLAKDVEKVQEQQLDKTENIEVLRLPYQDVLAMINKGEIWNTGTVAATFLVFHRLGLLGN